MKINYDELLKMDANEHKSISVRFTVEAGAFKRGGLRRFLTKESFYANGSPDELKISYTELKSVFSSEFLISLEGETSDVQTWVLDFRDEFPEVE